MDGDLVVRQVRLVPAAGLQPVLVHRQDIANILTALMLALHDDAQQEAVLIAAQALGCELEEVL
jgi:hypothetical protein